MDECTFMEDWDLQAVVRGCGSTEGFSSIKNSTPSLFSPLGFDQDEILSLSEMFQSATDHFDAKPPAFCSQSIHSPTSSMSTPSFEVKEEPEKLQKIYPLSESATPASPMATKSRKSRKNQQKRVVKQVAADDPSSDMWAWRKYGQKPIKGSPYPRSYYRCSSLKGCLARKQVERSSTDPSIFIITYTAEHSHAHPTRRNSLSGSTRLKPSVAKQIIPNSTLKDESLANSSTTPNSVASSTHEDDFTQHASVKTEEQEQEERSERNEIALPDIIFSEDLFPSLEELEGLFLDQFSASLP